MKRKVLLLVCTVIMIVAGAIGLSACSKVKEILLKAPENIAYDGTYITWDKVDNAEYYMVQIGNADAARSNSTTYYYEANGESFDVTVSSVLGDAQESASVTFKPLAVIEEIFVGNDGSNQKEVARDDGSFSFELDRGVRYVMLAGAKGYLNQKQEFVSDTTREDAEYWVDFILPAINKPQVVENIFYDFDKVDLRPESVTALDELVKVLEDNPNVTIEMASHADRKGSDEYNMRLSQRRAQSVIDYLVSKGIDEARLQPHGYGESRPKTVTKRIARLYPQFKEGDTLTPEFIEKLSPEDQEAADQINRRTEFQVLSLTYNMD